MWWRATEHSLPLLHTGLQTTRLSPASPTAAAHCRYSYHPQATRAPATACGTHGLRMFELWRALPWRAALPGLSSVRTLGGTRRQLSGLRNHHPARRSARTGSGGSIVIRQSPTGEGHDALFAQGLDNPRWVAHMTHPADYDGPPSPTIQASIRLTPRVETPVSQRPVPSVIYP